MTLKIWELVSILLSVLVTGVFWGPWVGLSRSIATFEPEVYLAIGHRMIRNLGALMPILMPAALLSIVPVLFMSYGTRPTTFYPTLAGFGLFLMALFVTTVIEVPIAKQIKAWTVPTLPANWQQLRDRWERFHFIRVVVFIAGLAFLVIGAIF